MIPFKKTGNRHNHSVDLEVRMVIAFREEEGGSRETHEMMQLI